MERIPLRYFTYKERHSQGEKHNGNAMAAIEPWHILTSFIDDAKKSLFSDHVTHSWPIVILRSETIRPQDQPGKE